MDKLTTFTTPNGENFVILVQADYDRLVEAADDAADVAAYDRAEQRLRSGEDELVPAAVAKRLLDGVNPVRVWREHRDMTAAELADEAGISGGFVSEIEAGKKVASLAAMQRIAAALSVNVDDIIVEQPVEDVTYKDTAIVKFASGTIGIQRGGALQPVVVKDELRPIADEIGVDTLNAKGKFKNTRTLGSDVIHRLTTQRDIMRRLVAEHGLKDRERLCRLYAQAEEKGVLLARRSNTHKLSAYDYARRLLDDGERKGWLK